MAINIEKLLPSSTKPSVGGALVKSSQKVIGAKSQKLIEDIGIIKVTTIQIDSILKGTLAEEKKKLDQEKRLESTKRREKQEEKLETKPKAEKEQIKVPSIPRMGFLDWVKNFIGNIILGYFAVRMIDYLPKIVPIIKFLGAATDFVLDNGGKLLDGLVSFVDWGYKAYDATNSFLKNLGGENFSKTFQLFSGALGTLIETSIIAATVVAGQGKDFFDGQSKTKSTPKGGKPKVTTGIGGKPKFKFPGTGPNITYGGGNKTLLSSVRPFLKRIPLPVIGALIDFGLSVAFGEDPGRAAFKSIGAALLGSVGAAIGSVVPIAGNIIGGIVGGVLGDVAGGALYDLFFGGKNPQQKNQKIEKKAGGGITRGGKARGGVKRTIGGAKKKGKYKRVLPQKPSKIEIKGDKTDINKQTGEHLDQTKYFGPILAITSKIMAKQEPTQKDYENVGLGLNLLISKGIEEGQLKGGLIAAFAEGGLVDADVLSAVETGSDISNWVSKTFKNEIESNAQKTLRLIREGKEKYQKEKKEKSLDPGGGAGGEFAPGSVPGGQLSMEQLVGLAKGAGFDNNEAVIMAAIAKAESGGNSNARNFKPPDKSYGLWQINMIGKLGPARIQEFGLQSEDQLFDPVTNAKAAYSIRKSQGLSAWTVYKTGAYRNHLAAAQAARNAPSLRVSPTNIQLGKGYGSEGSKIAGELGRFMKRKGVVPGSIHRHPEHPPYSLTSGHSRGSLHYQGRAIDLGANANEQGPVLAAIAEFNKLRGVKPVQLFHAGNEPSGHSDHVHVAYEKGGKTLGHPHIAMLGERGKEFVIDADSTAAIEGTFPGFLDAINKAKYKDAINVLRNYADYDQPEPEIVYVPVPVPTPLAVDNGYSGVGMVLDGSSNEDPFESLYMIG